MRALIIYNNFIRFNKLEKNTFKYFEIGVDWTLTIPILISRLGYDFSCIVMRKLIIHSLILIVLISLISMVIKLVN